MMISRTSVYQISLYYKAKIRIREYKKLWPCFDSRFASIHYSWII